MQRLLFGIFAHPDDEAFGPSGTLLHRVKEGFDLHLICVTDGAAGINQADIKNLGTFRSEEWRRAGKALGAVSMTQLGFEDGGLNNNQFHKLAEAIEKRINSICKSYKQPVELSFMTFDNTGLTGHLDHIAVSMVVSYVFCRYKNDSRSEIKINNLSYYCLPESVRRNPDTSFVFMPEGRSLKDIGHTEDVSDVLDKKLAIMRKHKSQISDAESVIKTLGNNISKECFVIRH